MRGIHRASAIAPRYLAHGVRVPGPDEDSFTLAVAALEELGVHELHPLRRLHLVGEFPEVGSWGFAALLGLDSLQLLRYPGNGVGLLSALGAAADDEAEEGPVAVVGAVVPPRTFEGSVPLTAAGAVAFRLDRDAGIEVRGSVSSPTDLHPPEQDESRSELEGWTESSLLATALNLESRVRRLSSQDTATVVAQSGEATAAVEVRRRGPSQWTGAFRRPASEAIPFDLDRWNAIDHRLPSDRSEGAYVPRPRYVESTASRWRFVAERCGQCGTHTFPARGRCRRCGEEKRLHAESLATVGATVVASTVIGAGGQPTEFDPLVESMGNYQVVLAEIAPGVRVTLQCTDAAPGSIAIGSTVLSRLRRLYRMEGEWRYGRKAVPGPADHGPGESAPLEAWRP